MKRGCWPKFQRPRLYLDLIRKITTISKISSRKVLITKRIGTIASNFDFGAANAGTASAGGFGTAGIGAGGMAGAGAGANLGACGIGGGAIAGIAGAAKGAGAGAATAGGAPVGGSAAGLDGPILEIMRVNSPGPELTGGVVGIGGEAGAGSAGVWARRWISRVTPPEATCDGSGDTGGGVRKLGSGR